MRYIMIYFNTIKKICQRIFEWLSCRTKPTKETSEETDPSAETDPSEEPDSEYIYLISHDIENVHLN